MSADFFLYFDAAAIMDDANASAILPTAIFAAEVATRPPPPLSPDFLCFDDDAEPPPQQFDSSNTIRLCVFDDDFRRETGDAIVDDADDEDDDALASLDFSSPESSISGSGRRGSSECFLYFGADTLKRALNCDAVILGVFFLFLIINGLIVCFELSK